MNDSKLEDHFKQDSNGRPIEIRETHAYIPLDDGRVYHQLVFGDEGYRYLWEKEETINFDECPDRIKKWLESESGR